MAFVKYKFNRIHLIVRILLVLIVLIAVILSATCGTISASHGGVSCNRFTEIGMWLRARWALFVFELLLLLFAYVQIIFMLVTPRKKTIELVLLIIELVIAVSLFVTETWYAASAIVLSTWAGAAASLLIGAILICVDIILSFKYAVE